MENLIKEQALQKIEESKPKVFEILRNIQQSLVSKKDKNNEFGGFRYRSAEDIIGAVKPLLNGCILKEEIEQVVLLDRVYMKVKVLITDGTDFECADGFAREPLDLPKMSQPQVTGSAYSYARKYALMSLFAIDNGEDDPDSKDNTAQQQSQQEKPWLNVPELHTVLEAVKTKGYTLQQVQTKYKVNKENIELIKAAELEYQNNLI